LNETFFQFSFFWKLWKAFSLFLRLWTLWIRVTCECQKKKTEGQFEKNRNKEKWWNDWILKLLKSQKFLSAFLFEWIWQGRKNRSYLFFDKKDKLPSVWKRLNLNYIWKELKRFKITFIKKKQSSFSAITKCFMSVGIAETFFLWEKTNKNIP
jgi:hypothetical protein